MDFIAPISVAFAVAIIFSTASALIPLLGPGVTGFLYQGLMSLLGFLPSRQKTWGTVYDSVTKRPIPYARVQLLDSSRRVLESRITDQSGRYGFLTTAENPQYHQMEISLLPTQKGYLFPAKVPPSVDQLVYHNLYHGGVLQAGDFQLINVDIPMDPISPLKTSVFAHAPSVALGAAVAASADAAFWLGLVMVPINFFITPNPFTFGTLCLFLGVASLRIFGVIKRPFGVVVDAQSGRAMPFTLITIHDTNGKRVGFTVSDELGRYIMLSEKGRYRIELFTSAGVVPPRHAKIEFEAKKGWITRELSL